MSERISPRTKTPYISGEVFRVEVLSPFTYTKDTQEEIEKVLRDKSFIVKITVLYEDNSLLNELHEGVKKAKKRLTSSSSIKAEEEKP